MITVTAESFQKHVHIGADDITLNGPPAALRGYIVLSNKAAEKVFIRELVVQPAKKGKRLAQREEAIRVTTALMPNEEKKHCLSHRVPLDTPPGEYDYTLQVGESEKKVRLVIQPHIEIDLHPLTVFFQGVKPGQTHQAKLMLTNNGNLPFTVPAPRHAIALDYDYLCRASSTSIKDHGRDGYMAFMDGMTKTISLEMADWVTVKLKEAGKVVAPCATIELNFSLTLPKNVEPGRDYFGNLRIWNRVLAYHIKSH